MPIASCVNALDLQTDCHSWFWINLWKREETIPLTCDTLFMNGINFFIPDWGWGVNTKAIFLSTCIYSPPPSLSLSLHHIFTDSSKVSQFANLCHLLSSWTQYLFCPFLNSSHSLSLSLLIYPCILVASFPCFGWKDWKLNYLICYNCSIYRGIYNVWYSLTAHPVFL